MRGFARSTAQAGFVFGIVAAAPVAQAAAPGDVASYRLEARVGLYCKLRTDTERPIFLNEAGAADLGGVHEICNRGAGYTVTARFQNVERGRVQLGGETVAITQSQAVFRSREARQRVAQLSLRGAALVDPSRPGYVTLAIAPIRI